MEKVNIKAYVDYFNYRLQSRKENRNFFEIKKCIIETFILIFILIQVCYKRSL